MRSTFTSFLLCVCIAVVRKAYVRARYTRDLVSTPDGGTISMDWWSGSHKGHTMHDASPVVLCLHAFAGKTAAHNPCPVHAIPCPDLLACICHKTAFLEAPTVHSRAVKLLPYCFLPVPVTIPLLRRFFVFFHWQLLYLCLSLLPYCLTDAAQTLLQHLLVQTLHHLFGKATSSASL